MFKHDLMTGQRVLVTGGGTGLGKAMAEGFLALGADIAICGRRKAVCDETAQAWRQQFPRARIDTFGVDIRIAPAVDEMVESLFTTGGLTGLVMYPPHCPNAPIVPSLKSCPYTSVLPTAGSVGVGAGSVGTGAGYRGVYKFDEVFVRGGAKLEFRDTNVVGTFTVDSTSSVIQNVP